MPTPAVEISSLVKRYGDRLAVDDVSITLPRGQLLALLGTNGAGKTTTIEICEGFRRPDSGTVRILGLDPLADAAKLRPQVGVMLQDGVGGYTAARAGELLGLFASYAARPLPVADLLNLVGLTDSARTPVKRLSGGQQQRLSLALALVSRPALLFLDEPTTGMDPHARRLTWDLIRRLRVDGVSIVLTTHYLAEAEELADTVVVLHAGRVVAQGTPAELTGARAENDQGQITFTTSAPLDQSSLAAALPAPCRLSQPRPGHYLITGPVTPQLLACATAWCASHDILAEEFTVGRRSLEDVFLAMTDESPDGDRREPADSFSSGPVEVAR